jgi:hypothetical protein
MDLLPFFQWMGSIPLSTYFLENTWPAPIAQVIHLVAVAVFIGALVVVDMRLLGRGLTARPLADVARDAQPWLIGAFLLLFITGLPSLTSTALKQYYSPFFWWKMEALLLGVVFTFTVRRKIILTDEARLGPVWPKVVGVLSLGIWTSVTIGARLIGLMG